MKNKKTVYDYVGLFFKLLAQKHDGASTTLEYNEMIDSMYHSMTLSMLRTYKELINKIYDGARRFH
jgi:hypothetical protein